MLPGLSESHKAASSFSLVNENGKFLQSKQEILNRMGMDKDHLMKSYLKYYNIYFILLKYFFLLSSLRNHVKVKILRLHQMIG